MQVKQEQVSPCQIELEIEIEAEQVFAAVDQTYTELGKVANIHGFRKGKAPRHILEAYLDRDKVKDRVADKLMQPAYVQALEDGKIDPYAPGDVEIVKFEFGEPLVFKARVPLPPKTELGQYVGLEIERKVQLVTDEEVEGEIKKLLERHAEYAEVADRPVQTGDAIVVAITDESDPDSEPKRNAAVVGENLPDFDNGVVGMNVGEHKTIEIGYPEDFADEELRGTVRSLGVTLVQIQSRTIPELSDEWVKKAFVPEPAEGEEPKEPSPDAVDTADKLRDAIRKSMERAAQDVAQTDVENTIVKQIVESSTADFPEVMVMAEVNERIEHLLEELNKRKVTLDDYLKHTEQTFEQLRDSYADDSRKQLRTTLVLHEVVEKESIKVEDGDIEAEVRRLSEQQNVPVETIEAYLDRTDGRQSIRNRILQKKLMDFLVAASNIKSVAR